MDTLLKDLRYALRSLRGKPGFTAIAVATLALGIGGSTAIFSLTSAVLLARPPLRDPDRLVTSGRTRPKAGFPRNDLSPAQYAALRDQAQSFEGLAAVAEGAFTLTSDGEPQKIEARRVTASFFAVLGVAPALGRAIEPADDRPGAPHVAVLSHGLWQRRFGGDAGIVGRDVLMSGDKYTVIGVMPREFQFLESYVALWVPAAFEAEELGRRSHYLTVVGRLRPGVTAAAAEADVAADRRAGRAAVRRRGRPGLRPAAARAARGRGAAAADRPRPGHHVRPADHVRERRRACSWPAPRRVGARSRCAARWARRARGSSGSS